MTRRFASLLLLWSALATCSQAFVKPTPTLLSLSETRLTRSWQTPSGLYSSPGDDNTQEAPTTPDDVTSLNDTIEQLQQSSPTAVLAEQEDVEYPLDVPSPVLLASSIVLAISSTGSLFNCIEGNITPVSLGLAVIGFPLFLFLLYAAILKGAAETKEDDERYLNGN
uniref:PSII 6.1 kDa protein n=1 Tax=Entomoneis paludosa TaxID=265537 RepID=A0A7S2Y7X1_9STRA|eukprot:CAMPEP_0172471052 /NCGR_PEP_ID=MMETSP1065-20121228/67619_1 /TAXON_ID=265537 /ORGANISM="Amphiprora paludosa, Strain CCMP125" /LENGTH=166 /DNA_ID=CAMNT_0013229137 /DNA_START=39 /DNA_END=542 /DNA_ORIENTATION=-